LPSQRGARSIDVIDVNGELELGSRTGWSERGWSDHLGYCPLNEQVDQGVAEAKDNRVSVREVDRQSEDPLIEGPRSVEIPDEQTDGGNASWPLAHAASLAFRAHTD
jgi:hypothetical protein